MGAPVSRRARGGLPSRGRAPIFRNVPPHRICRGAPHPRLARAGRRAQGLLGCAQVAIPPRATTGRPVRSIRKSPPRSTSTRPRAITTASAATPRATPITFVRETENLGFMEAVELLAGEAGMAMPARDPAAAARAAANQGLVEAMEAAVRFFRAQLAAARAAEARAYLDRRGLSAADPRPLRDRLRPRRPHRAPRAPDRQGLRRARLAEAGLVGLPQDGGSPYDRFRSRIMFPIRDARGRAIAFGARAIAAGPGAEVPELARHAALRQGPHPLQRRPGPRRRRQGRHRRRHRGLHGRDRARRGRHRPRRRARSAPRSPRPSSRRCGSSRPSPSSPSTATAPASPPPSA